MEIGRSAALLLPLTSILLGSPSRTFFRPAFSGEAKIARKGRFGGTPKPAHETHALARCRDPRFWWHT
jgi:hypothetical protein